MRLYTITGYITKGGVKLPVLRCARGSTSLESFHLHIARFIPGSSTNAVNYQAYLLEGITRWNSLRAIAAINSPSHTTQTFDSRLQDRVCTVIILYAQWPKLSMHLTVTIAIRDFVGILKEGDGTYRCQSDHTVFNNKIIPLFTD